MKTLLSILLLFALAGELAGQAKPVAASAKKIQGLIKQLGANQFSQREAATESLLQIGLPALQPLLVTAKVATDKEMRLRATRIARIIRNNDLKAKMIAFRNGKSAGKQLAGWKQFRTLAGDTRNTRRLFVQMLQSQPTLFSLLQSANYKAVAEELNVATSRAATRRQFGDTVEVGVVAALLFVAGDAKVGLDATTSLLLSSNLCFLPSIQSTILGGPKKSIMRKLIGQVMKRNNSAPSQPYWLMLAMDHDISVAGLNSATRILRNKPSTLSAEYALLTIARFGKPEHASLAESFVSDARQIRQRRLVINGQRRIAETRIGDVAMAVTLLLEKRDLAKFGFKNTRRHRTRALYVNSLGFNTKAERDFAMARFAMRKKK